MSKKNKVVGNGMFDPRWTCSLQLHLWRLDSDVDGSHPPTKLSTVFSEKREELVFPEIEYPRQKDGEQDDSDMGDIE